MSEFYGEPDPPEDAGGSFPAGVDGGSDYHEGGYGSEHVDAPWQDSPEFQQAVEEQTRLAIDDFLTSEEAGYSAAGEEFSPEQLEQLRHAELESAVHGMIEQALEPYQGFMNDQQQREAETKM